MYKVTDFADPWDAVKEFESAVAAYAGAPYCITTDNGTHAIKIAMLLKHNKQAIAFPARTYLSVLMVMHELGIPYTLTDTSWRGEYLFEGTNIWDSARIFEENMYRPGAVQCVSFGHTKPLQIGRGGCILTDDPVLYKRASRMRMDGRDIFTFNPWADQKEFELGFHYYMRPEECVTGLNLLLEKKFTQQEDRFYNYPDCRTIKINH